MRVFFDTSALTKRYVEEVGSEQVRALCAEADALGVSVLVLPELISTLCRLVREGRLSSEDYRSLKFAVQADLSDAAHWPAMEGRSLSGYQLKKLWLNSGQWKFQQVAQAIEKVHIEIAKRVGETETLYGSVTATDIADELEKKGITVDRRKIDLEGGIKTVGDHQVRIYLHPEVSAEIVVTVVPEES